MNADKHEFFDSLTERVLAAVFEVSNTLGAGGIRASAQSRVERIVHGFQDRRADPNTGCGETNLT